MNLNLIDPDHCVLMRFFAQAQVDTFVGNALGVTCSHLSPGIIPYYLAQNPAPSFFAVQEIMAALPLLHKDFQGYAHYFYENRLKEAVAAAFERYENRLNEIRSGSTSPTVRAASGHPLVYRLFAEAELVRPYAALGAKDSYEKGLTGILSGALEWIRNPYTHQKHELPDLTPSEALELLFVASYLMRMLELSKP
jgi:hypothetical protein